ncbi:hypothetical protein D4Q76_02630 [archaeon]|nr:MAG: hypothetical protein D4Q76_02630 [archaeon]
MDSKRKIMVITIIGLILFATLLISNSKTIRMYADSKYCEKNEDCVLINTRGACCGVMDTAVNMLHRKVCNVECAVFTNSKTVCINNQCNAVKINASDQK